MLPVLAHEWSPEDRGVHHRPDRRGEPGGLCSQNAQCGGGQGTYRLSVVEGKVHIVSAHSVWWRARYI